MSNVGEVNNVAIPLYIDNVRIKTPHEFRISRFNLTKAGRVASGQMVMDLIAKKRKFEFTYNILSGKEFEDILALIDANKMFFVLTYTENDIIKTATVYTGSITQDKFRSDTGAWYWKNVSFDLIEQ